MHSTTLNVLVRRSFVALVFLAASLIPPQGISSARAEGLDHMQCFRVRDGISGSFSAELSAAGATLPNTDGCRVKLKAKQICRPVSMSIDESELPFGTLDGDPDAFYKICYRAKCPSVGIVEEIFSDGFATRSFTKWKTSLICTPALRGDVYDVTFGLDDTTELFGIQVDVQYGAAGGEFEGRGASVSCTTPLVDPDAVALLDADDTRVLNAMMIEGDGIQGPGSIFTCRFAKSGGPPATSDFAIVSVGIDMADTVTAPTVSVSSIVPAN